MKFNVTGFRPFQGAWRRALSSLSVFAGLAVLVVVAFAAQLVFATSMPWETALRVSLHHWFVPLLVFILGSSVARGFPVERGRLGWAVPMHLAAGALVIALAGRLEKEMFPSVPPRLAIHRWYRPASTHDNAPRFTPGEPPGLPVPPGDRGSTPRAHGHFFAMIVSSRWQPHFAVLAVSMSVTHAWRLYQRVQERDRRTLELTARLSQAKLEALRLQLQPHFLFNTLNTISSLVHRDVDAADEMITNLSELLRLSLDVGEQEVPLRRELEILDCYLAIEQARLGRRLRVERQIDEAALDGLVPSLVLQPVVENAVRHGLEPRVAPGTITIRAERVADILRLVVTDDGPGLKPADARTERRGIGLANTEARLRELHGPAARLVLREPPDGGVRVEIELPFRRR